MLLRSRSHGIRCGAAAAIAIGVFTLAGATPASGRPRTTPGRPAEIAFVSGRGFNGSNIWTIAPSGAGLRRITRSGGGIFAPAFSPDGLRIAFLEGGTDIVVVNRDGSGRRRLTPPRRRVENMDPAWSPDGSRIVFTKASRSIRVDLFLMNANGTHVRRLTRSSACENDPSWSPDGRWLAFDVGCQGRGSIALMSIDGRGRRTLAMFGSGPDWSPDGTRIAYTVAGDRIETVDVSTGATTSIAVGPIAQVGVAWSPDGTRLAFTRLLDCTGTPFEYASRIGIVEIATGVVSTLRPFPDGCWDDLQPSWAPRCTLYGTARNDRLRGTAGEDVICGLRGNDTIEAGAGDDVVLGGDGNDTIAGGSGRDRLFGAAGSDTILARDAEQDVVDGGPGIDRARADANVDLVAGVERRG